MPPPRSAPFTAIGDDGRPRQLSSEVDPGTRQLAAELPADISFPSRHHFIVGRSAVVFPVRVGEDMRSCAVGFDVLARRFGATRSDEAAMITAFERNRPAVEALALAAIWACGAPLPAEIAVLG